jgi:pimeloyl-ACP methyl ester carboxylesterase
MIFDLQACFQAFQEQHPLRSCQVGGQTWEYMVGGNGEALLMLPGFFGVAGTDFLYLLAFEQSYRVFSLSYPPQGNHIETLVEGLAGFMDQQRLLRAHFLGGSYSGYIAQAFVRRYPQRVHKLVLAQTSTPRRKHLPLALGLAILSRCLPMGILRWLMYRSLIHFMPGNTPQQAFWRAYFRELIPRFSRAMIEQRLRVTLDYHRRWRFTAGDLAGWSGKVLILESDHENLLAQDEADILRQVYPHTRHRLIPGGHTSSVDEPALQMAAILEFLQEPG